MHHPTSVPYDHARNVGGVLDTSHRARLFIMPMIRYTSKAWERETIDDIPRAVQLLWFGLCLRLWVRLSEAIPTDREHERRTNTPNLPPASPDGMRVPLRCICGKKLLFIPRPLPTSITRRVLENAMRSGIQVLCLDRGSAPQPSNINVQADLSKHSPGPKTSKEEAVRSLPTLGL